MPSDPFFYRFIPEREVPLPVFLAAHRALEISEARLGLSGVKILWCLPTDKPSYELEEIWRKIGDNFARMVGGSPARSERSIQQEAKGEFHGSTIPLLYPNMIIVRADLLPERVVSTVAHECQHVRDWAYDPSSWGGTDETEARAQRFEQEVVTAIGPV